MQGDLTHLAPGTGSPGPGPGPGPEWDDYFMGICDAVSLKSKDRSTKLGAVIVGTRNEILSTGFNGFPRGIDDNVSERHTRPVKYMWTEHAERNAIYCARVPLVGGRLYCRWPPCPDCARGIIQVGLVEVIWSGSELPERWQGDMALADAMLREAGVKIRTLKSKSVAERLTWLENALSISDHVLADYFRDLVGFYGAGQGDGASLVAYGEALVYHLKGL